MYKRLDVKGMNKQQQLKTSFIVAFNDLLNEVIY